MNFNTFNFQKIVGAKYQKPENVFDDTTNSLLCTYRFLTDVFINSMILEVDIKIPMVVLNFIYHYPLRMQEVFDLTMFWYTNLIFKSINSRFQAQIVPKNYFDFRTCILKKFL